MLVKKIMLMGVVLLFIVGCGADTDANVDNIGAAIDYTITGIEPGAGTTTLARQTLEDYDNLAGYQLEEASTAAMLTALRSAIDNEEPIVVTGWTPHWKFAQYDLKFLDDPKEVFGGSENINTITRLGLEDEMPEAYTILDRFYWGVEDMEEVMFLTQDEDLTFEEAANRWIGENEETVAEWTAGVDQVDGTRIELVSTPWDTERSSTAVVAEVLSRQGYNVRDTPVDPAIMFQSVATSDADASVAPWLPITHGSFFDEYQDSLIDLGANLEGAKIGFVVPSYMDIDSMEDLEPVE